MTIGVGFPDVLRGARAGADWAFEALYRDLAPSVLGYLRGQGVPDPEDLASEVFVGIVRNIASFEGDERALRAWVFSIAHNRLVDQRRRRSRRPEHLTDPGEFTGPMVESLVADAEEGRGTDRWPRGEGRSHAAPRPAGGGAAQGGGRPLGR